LNDDAQRNIAAAIKTLIESGQADLIAVEGGFGPVDFGTLRDTQNPKISDEVGRFLLEQKKISGPFFAALTAAAPAGHPLPAVVGIDDRDAYARNVRAYLDSRDNVSSAKKDLAGKFAR
jgi:hypothetical protein